jgi:hypothetical protein
MVWNIFESYLIILNLKMRKILLQLLLSSSLGVLASAGHSGLELHSTRESQVRYSKMLRDAVDKSHVVEVPLSANYQLEL